MFVFQLPLFSEDNRGKDGDECGGRGVCRVFSGGLEVVLEVIVLVLWLSIVWRWMLEVVKRVRDEVLV